MGQVGGRQRGEERSERGDKGRGSGGGGKSKAAPKPDPPVSRFGRRRRVVGEASAPFRLPGVGRLASRLKLMRVCRVRDWLALQKAYLTVAGDRVNRDEELMRELVEANRGTPCAVYQLEEFVGDDHAVVSFSGLGEYYCRIHSMVDKDALEPRCSVLVTTSTPPHPALFIVGVLDEELESPARCLLLDRAPAESFKDVGGLEEQVEQLLECVELPLLQPELFEEMGITPPKGVILYGPPGTGKTLLAKAVANRTNATFLRCVGSELIQRHAGEGPKLVRELFKLAAAHSPSIIFFDEIDAVGTKRYDTGCGGEREIQRTLLELLNQLDGFAAHKDVKIIMATNQIDSLDPALIRPGRIDRKIEIPPPTSEQLARIFKIHTERMSLAPDARDFAQLGWDKRELSGADIKAVCSEAGMRCLRDRRAAVSRLDFHDAIQSVLLSKTSKTPATMYI